MERILRIRSRRLPSGHPRRKSGCSSTWTKGSARCANAYPELSYTFSFESVSGPNARKLDTSALDIAEVHVWLSSDLEFSSASGQLAVVTEQSPDALPAHAEKAPEVYYSERDRWLSSLEQLVDEWADWAAARRASTGDLRGLGPNQLRRRRFDRGHDGVGLGQRCLR